jgi:hypothetical protein
MKWIKGYQLFKESKSYSNKNLVLEICTAMVLLNNDFLDNILDRGLKARYSENSDIFLTDLKNLLIAKNRLRLGKFESGKFVDDDEISKINGIFEGVNFDIEKDWNLLINSRNTARSIIDKLIPDSKLSEQEITKIFWIGPNKNPDYQEDIVVELSDETQYSFYLNKNLSSQKTSSFLSFAEVLIGSNIDRLYSEEYLEKWNKLTQTWVQINYENTSKEMQRHIEKFIDPKRIESLTYFEYFDIKHPDPKFKHLGEYIEAVDKNILKLEDLISANWKMRDKLFIDLERVESEWFDVKNVILNSKILENLLTNSLKTQFSDDIKKMDDNFKLAGGDVKMKLFKVLIDKMSCLERPVYYLSNGGNEFVYIPSRDFFRQNYDDLSIKFDYHVKFDAKQEDSPFNITLIVQKEDIELIKMFISVDFTSNEMSGKLSAKYKYELPDNFNYLVSKDFQPE